jgi:hypothetical protein
MILKTGALKIDRRGADHFESRVSWSREGSRDKAELSFRTNVGGSGPHRPQAAPDHQCSQCSREGKAGQNRHAHPDRTQLHDSFGRDSEL